MDDIVPLKEKDFDRLPVEFSYLTEEESKMPSRMALSQLALGLQTCKTEGDAVDLLNDAFILGKRTNKEAVEGLKKDIEDLTLKDDDEEKSLCLDEIEIIERLIDARFGTHEKKT